MSKPSMIERLKDVALVVLLISTILLLYFFWGNISFDDLKQPAEQTEVESPETAAITKPDKIIVNFGADNYTMIPPGGKAGWYNKSGQNTMLNELRKFVEAENIFVEEISSKQYQEVMKYRSIRAEFGYNIPMADFCQNFTIDKAKSFDSVETVTTICYSTASSESMFIYDGKNNKYYRLVSDKDRTGLKALIASVESEGYNIYYPISTYLGVDNNTLVPLTLETDLRKFTYKQENYSDETDKINAMAEEFFGENFDFVRRIIEDKGTVIYMYGYGQMVLIVNTDGSIEYKEEQAPNNTEQSFLESLKTAVEFVARHGSWKSIGGVKLDPYLKSVIVNPDKQKGYQFTFGIEINGNRLYYEDGAPIVINVIKGQVTYYKRNLIDFNQKDLEAVETNAKEAAFSSVNLIATNYRYIYKILLKEGVVSASTDQAAMFEYVASLVNSMQSGYVKQKDQGLASIRPAWVVTIKNISVYFDLYDAEPLGYSKD